MIANRFKKFPKHFVLSFEVRPQAVLQRFAVVNRGGEERRVDLIEKVFLDLAKRFRDRHGGYTRIVKLGRRRGDNAAMSLIEFVELGEGGGASTPAKAKGKAKSSKAEKAEAAEPAKAEKSEEKPKRAKKPKAESDE